MPQTASTVPKRRESYKLGVNAYDRASSLLLSLIVLVGAGVGGLLIVFFARQLRVVQTAIPVTAIDPGERSPDAAMGLKEDIEPPGIEEAPELDQPQLQDTLQALTSAVSNRQAILSDESIDSSDRAAKGQGFGDARQAGTGSGVPIREPRREVRFDPSSIEEYARFLDSYGIEITVWGDRDGKLYYASNLSKERPDTRVLDDYRQDRRLSMRSIGPPMEQLDLRLARKAGISDKGRTVFQFYPDKAAGILLGLEKQAAGDTPIEALALTAFRVTKKGDQFIFSVEEQQ